MAKRIRDVAVLRESLVNKNLENLPLTSPKITVWKCRKCKGTWREGVKKRQRYELCPECEPDGRHRTAIVSHEESSEVHSGSPKKKESKNPDKIVTIEPMGNVPQLAVRQLAVRQLAVPQLEPRNCRGTYSTPSHTKQAPAQTVQQPIPPRPTVLPPQTLTPTVAIKPPPKSRPRSPRSQRSVTSLMDVAHTTIRRFDANAIQFSLANVAFAKTLIPLYRKQKAAIFLHEGAVDRFQTKGVTGAEWNKAFKDSKRYAEESQILNEEFNDAILESPFYKSYEDIIGGCENPEDSMKTLRTLIYEYHRYSDNIVITSDIQSNYTRIIELANITARDQHSSMLKDNNDLITTLLEYINKEMTDEEWKLATLVQARERFLKIVRRKAVNWFAATLCAAIEDGAKRLKKGNPPSGTSKKSTQSAAILDEVFNDLGNKLEEARLKTNEFIRTELREFSPTEYELFDMQYSLVAGNKVPKPRKIPSQTSLSKSDVPTAVVASSHVLCDICYFDRHPSEMTKCVYCDFVVCSTCVRQHILSKEGLATCMNTVGDRKCERPYTQKWLVDNLGKEWYISVYQPRVEEIAINKARSHIPEVIPIVPLYRERAELKAKIYEANQRTLYETVHLPRHKQKERRKLVEREEALKQQIANAIAGNAPTDADKQSKYIQGCATEGCNGLVSADNYTCTVCNVEICKLCRVQLKPGQHQVGLPTDVGVVPHVSELKDPQTRGLIKPHVCKKEDVETVKNLEETTKPCPVCATLVYKIDGCDQMWCLNCHTAFDWITGEIERGVIHNPEYFRWMREQGNVIPRTDVVDNEADACITTDARLNTLSVQIARKIMAFYNDRAVANVNEILRHARHSNPEAAQNLERENERNIRSNLLRELVKKITPEEWRKRTLIIYGMFEAGKSSLRAHDAMAIILTELATQFNRELQKLNTTEGNIRVRRAKVITYTDAFIEKANEARLFLMNIMDEENYMTPKENYVVLDAGWDWRKRSMVNE